jgi:membrane peptidoglycan carboxypeptidase
LSVSARNNAWLSRNAAAAGVAYDVGIADIIKTAHAMGIVYKLDPFLSTSLGASVVVPLEICSAYGTLANHGVHNPPTGIMRVTTSDGEVLYEYHPNPTRSVPADIADTMKEMMRGVIEHGTARAARCPFPASGKTGTTNSYRDAWFIGYTDDLVTAVWVGNRHNQPMNRTYGGTVPAPIWRQFMMVAQPIMASEHKGAREELGRINDVPALGSVNTTPTPYIEKLQGKQDREHKDSQQEDQTAQEETPPPPVDPGDKYTVAVCAETGDRATKWCPETMMVTYIKGRQPAPPSRTCTVHTGPEAVPDADNDTGRVDNRGRQRREQGIIISICAETGKIATDKCPTVLLRRFHGNAPTETCPLHGE